MSLMQRAVVEMVLIGVLAGAVGVHVVLRRLPFFAMATSHATFPGVALAALLGLPLLLGSLGFALIFLGVILLTTSVRGLQESSVVGVVLAGSFGLGALVHGLQPSPRISLGAALVGQVLGVTTLDIFSTAAVGVVVLAFLVGAHRPLIFGAFDSEAALAAGFGQLGDAMLLAAVTVTVVTCVPAVGTILSVALLVVPAMTARLWTDRLGHTFVASILCAVSSGLVGLAVSQRADLAAGASIVLTTSALYAVSWLLAPRGIRAGR